MKVRNITFITPLIEDKTYKLDKKYSKTLKLQDNSEINLYSNIGPRPNQEDTVAVQIHGNYILLLVADGMGGRIKGSEASYTTSKTIIRWFRTLSQRKLMSMDEFTLRNHIVRLINEMKDHNFPVEGGTTLNMSIIGPEKTYIINVGDSRAYSIKNDEITLRTIDDSLAFDEFNPSTAEERDTLRFYEQNNIITNCIEMGSLTRVRIKTIKNADYDIICHMTDGVSDILAEDEIKTYCVSENPAETLVEKAVTSDPVNNTKNNVQDFVDFIYPHDNASAVVYTKKRIKNN